MRPLTSVTLLVALSISIPAATADASGIAWPSWRGPRQNGTSHEVNLPAAWTVDGENHRWTYPLAGRGTPAIADGRIYALGYDGEGADLREILVCLDETTGTLIWEHRESDFLSDAIYSRYSIGAPAIDPETGNVYWLTTPGLLCCLSPDGELLWQHSMMESYGRLTFPNGRTGAPLIDGDLVITRGITTNWGAQGPARDRFYAFDKRTGRPVWASTPGTGPKDSCFSHPVLAWRSGRRVLYAGTGCGNVICLDARTGAPVWRFPMSIGGVNSAVILGDDRLFAIHGRENLDGSTIGRMVAIRLAAAPARGEAGPVVLGADDEIWRNDLGAFSSSPVLVGDRLYVTVHTGDLCCVDTDTGRVLWKEKLAPDQIHASPVYGDGKLYVPMTNGSFFIIEPSDEGPQILCKVQLEGNCLGAPAIASGRVYVHTTEKLYCFGREGGVTPPQPFSSQPAVAVEPAALVCSPCELALRPGETAGLDAWTVDRFGSTSARHVRDIRWSVPPALQVTIDEAGRLAVEPGAPAAAGVIVAEWNGVKGAVRLRILPGLPYAEDFESFDVSRPHATEPDVRFAFPPSPWIAARLKWEVREVDGGHVLARTIDRALFQRTMSFIGHPDLRNYTAQIDVMSDGNRRMMSTAGLINQRYMILLKGNHQQLEISSNQERIKHAVPFRWRPRVWYRLRSRVDTQSDGSAIVRAKAWPRDEPEPDGWTIEFVHAHGHAKGAPGLFGFTPQSRFRVYIDNIMVTSNE